MKDYFTAFIFKYRRAYIALYIPALIIMVGFVSIAPNLMAGAQLSSSSGTDLIGDLGYPDTNINPNDYTIRFVDALHMELTFNNKPDKKIVFASDTEERGGQDETYFYDATGRVCPGRVVYNRNNGTAEVDLDFRLSASSTSSNNGCVNTAENKYGGVGVGNLENFDAYFQVSDKGTITRVDGDTDWIFDADPADPNRYTRRSEADGSCTDTLIVENDKVYLYELSSDKTTPRGTFNGDPPFDAPGCKYRSTAVGNDTIPNNEPLQLATDSLSNRDKEKGTGSTGVGGTSGDENPSCETSITGNPMSWFMCPIFNGVVDSIAAIFRNFIDPFLHYNPINTTPSADNAPYQVWSQFRFFANIILVGAFLVAVFGQSVGGGLIDAYTAKKMLPRILIAAVLVNISIYLVAFASDVVNIIGKSIGSVMTAPFKNANAFNVGIDATDFSAGFITALIAIPLAIYKISAAGGVGNYLLTLLMSVFVPLFIVTLAIFATLIIRRGLILFLAMVSPIAFALYAIPTTEKYFKKWWDLYSKTLMVYPIVVVMFSLSNIMFATTRIANDDGVAGILASLASFVILFIPLAMIPFAFKLAGSVLGGVYGAVQGQSSKVHQMAMGDARDPHSFASRWAAKRRDRATELRGDAIGASRFDAVKTQEDIDKLQKKADNGTITDDDRLALASKQADMRRHRGGRGRLLRAKGRFIDRTSGESVDAEMSRLNKEKAEIRDNMIATGDDTLAYAGAGWEQIKDSEEKDEEGNALFKGGRFYDGKGREISKETYKAGKRYFGQSNQAIAQNLEYILRKAQTDKDVAQFRKTFTKNAVQENWSPEEVMGAWATATYPHKTEFPSEWYSSPTVVSDDNGRITGLNFKDVASNDTSFDSWVGDISRTKEGFRLSSIRDQDWRMLDTRRQELEGKAMAGTATQDDLSRMAKIHAVFDAAAQKTGYNPDGGTLDADKVVSSGASAVGQKVIQSAMGSSRKGKEINYVDAYTPSQQVDASQTVGRIADVDLVHNGLTIVPAGRVITPNDATMLANAGSGIKWSVRGENDSLARFVDIRTAKTEYVRDDKGQVVMDKDSGKPRIRQVWETVADIKYDAPALLAEKSDAVRSQIINVEREDRRRIQPQPAARPGAGPAATIPPGTPTPRPVFVSGGTPATTTVGPPPAPGTTPPTPPPTTPPTPRPGTGPGPGPGTP